MRRTEPRSAAAPAAPPAERPRAERRRPRRRAAGAAAAGAVGVAVLAIARLVMTVAVLIALLIGLGILLRDLDANQANTIVHGIQEGANFFAGSFTGLVRISGHYKREITLDWGIAIVVYLLVGALLAGAIARTGRRGVAYEQTSRPAV